MENEMMCTICGNLFIEAVTLGCSHSFCQYCIEKWKKMKSDCPICRKKITSSTRTLALDNIIEKMMESASAEDKDQRKKAVEERKKIDEAENAARNLQNTVNNRRNTARRGRRNGAGNNNRRRNNNVAAAPPQPPPQPPPRPFPAGLDAVISLSDLPSTTDSENSEDSDLEDSDLEDSDLDDNCIEQLLNNCFEDERCYICGDFVYWENGWPNR